MIGPEAQKHKTWKESRFWMKSTRENDNFKERYENGNLHPPHGH